MSARALSAIARDLNTLLEAATGPALHTECVYRHPDGRLVYVDGGSYMGTYGISNHFSWREVLADGSLSEKREEGYGWGGYPVQCRIVRRVEFGPPTPPPPDPVLAALDAVLGPEGAPDV